MTTHKKVKDILIPKERLIVIPERFKIRQALKTLREGKTDKADIQVVGFLVLGDNNELLGSLCLKEFIKGLAPQFLQPVSSAQVVQENEANLAELWDSVLEDQSRRFSEEPVSKYYAPIKTSVEPEDVITKAAYLMLFHDLTFLPVLEQKRRLVGVVTIFDVFRELSLLIMED